MTCKKCGSTIPLKAKFCPECGNIIDIKPKCTNGHLMKLGQKFCCECGAPVAEYVAKEYPPKNCAIDKAHESHLNHTQSSDKSIRLIVKIIATVIIIGIAVSIAASIGGFPSYVVGGLCFVILPNVWKLIDEG